MYIKIFKQRIKSIKNVRTETGIKKRRQNLPIWEPAQLGPQNLDTSLSVTVYGTIWVFMGITQSNLRVAF